MASATDYPVFLKWYQTTNWIMDRCERMPKHTRFSLTGRILQITLEVQELLLEAIYNKEKRVEYLSDVNIRLEKLRIFFRLCKDRRYISFQQYQYIVLEFEQVGKMVGGWIKSS